MGRMATESEAISANVSTVNEGRGIGERWQVMQKICFVFYFETLRLMVGNKRSIGYAKGEAAPYINT